MNNERIDTLLKEIKNVTDEAANFTDSDFVEKIDPLHDKLRELCELVGELPITEAVVYHKEINELAAVFNLWLTKLNEIKAKIKEEVINLELNAKAQNAYLNNKIGTSNGNG